jgi:hypothetical protein
MMAIRILVAAMFAAMCIFGKLVGRVGVLGLGVIAMALSKPVAADGKSSPSPKLRQFAPWLICIVLFGFFVLLFAPFADLPAVIVALLILAPLFGTMVYTASSAVSGLIRC